MLNDVLLYSLTFYRFVFQVFVFVLINTYLTYYWLFDFVARYDYSPSVDVLLSMTCMFHGDFIS